MDTTNNALHADVLVIGFGKGGKAVAATMGGLGTRVVLVEQSDQMYGGTCPNVGCVPTKALVHHSRKRRADDPAQEWYERSVTDVQALTTLFRGGNYDALNGADTVTVVTGRATFTDPHTVEVGAGSDAVTITGETILINTGSQPVIPDIPGLRASRYTVTSTDLIHTTTLPARLAIVGGGYLGIEFASIYRQFGSRVTVLESAEKILGREDDDVASAAPPATGRSRSTSTCAPASRTSTPSVTSTAGRSSPTSPSTTAGSSWTSSSATAGARRRTVSRSPRPCS